MCAGTTVQPSAASWQEPHERPFVPSDWKNRLPRSIAPLLVTVRTLPDGSANTNMFGAFPLAGAAVAAASAARHVAMATPVRAQFAGPMTISLLRPEGSVAGLVLPAKALFPATMAHSARGQFRLEGSRRGRQP